MFKLFSRPKPKEDAFDFTKLKVDMHSHLLPGIDDGARDLHSSVTLIKGLKALGYKKLITTPHIMWDMYRNTPEIIKEKLQTVKEAVAGEGIEIELHAAAEYFLDYHMEELLAGKEPLLTISENKVLVEMSLAFPAMNTKELLFELEMQGYQPVMAHPERYIYLQQNKGFFDELKDMGCLFQLNLLSLTGQYGRTVQELAQHLLKKNYYDMMGTDLHNTNHLQGLQNLKAGELINQWLDSGSVLNSQL